MAELLYDMNGLSLLETILASAMKGITKQLFTGIWATYKLLELKTEMLPLASVFRSNKLYVALILPSQ